MIDMRGIFKSFGPLRVLNDVSIRVDRGQVVVVIGPSGSGKSTLLRCINRLEAVDSGEIEVDGRSLQDPKLDVNDLRRQIGVVFQSFNLFPHLSVLDNLTLAPRWVLKMPRADAEAGPGSSWTRSASRRRPAPGPRSSRAASSSASRSRGRCAWSRR